MNQHLPTTDQSAVHNLLGQKLQYIRVTSTYRGGRGWRTATNMLSSTSARQHVSTSTPLPSAVSFRQLETQARTSSKYISKYISYFITLHSD